MYLLCDAVALTQFTSLQCIRSYEWNL